jgi:hypothetical protein
MLKVPRAACILNWNKESNYKLNKVSKGDELPKVSIDAG